MKYISALISCAKWVGLQIRRCAIWGFERIPLVGGLTQARPKSCIDALKELSFLFSLSLLPLVFTWITEILTKDQANTPTHFQFWETIGRNIKSGEVFIFVNSLLAPVGYILYKNMRDGVRYPNAMFSIWALMIMVGISALIFALQRTGVLKNGGVLDTISWTVFLVALTMRYTSIVYDGLRVDFVTNQKLEENELIKKLKASGQ